MFAKLPQEVAIKFRANAGVYRTEEGMLSKFIASFVLTNFSFYFRLEDALKKIGVHSLFPVQAAVWQETIGPGAFERDICVNSPTGSGKTLAYALPIVQMLSTRKVRCLRALVVLPTRDLALQVIITSIFITEIFLYATY